MSLAFLFPGQGSQAVGMGADLAAAFAPAREVFQEVDEALGQKLSTLMREGPEDQLTLTENAQPALMAVSLAVIRTLEREFGVGIERAAFVAGHSLGEYSALCAAGALSEGRVRCSVTRPSHRAGPATPCADISGGFVTAPLSRRSRQGAAGGFGALPKPPSASAASHANTA